MRLIEALAKPLRTRRSASLQRENRPYYEVFGGPRFVVAVFGGGFARASISVGIMTGLCLFIAACATNDKIPVEATIKRADVVYLIKTDKPFTGVSTATYMNENPKTSIEYRDGIKDGQQIEWLENGRKKEIITWRNGMRDGDQIQWYENEQKAFQGRMQQGKWDGECRGWYPDGKPAFQIFFKDGQGKGRTVVIKWNKDNLIREFPDVQIEGEWIEWHASGKITRHEKYRDGKLVEKLK